MSIARHDAADADRLVIGRFARRAGLSIGALRHHDEVGLLRPAWVDPDIGYRYCGADQLTTATLIALPLKPRPGRHAGQPRPRRVAVCTGLRRARAR